ncbi:MAG: GIY-YIG nuclease family protein [Candidatus Omnitrophica bacterium]|nr:GIY-YIG nuclease family protein [Candidatus Omnitrophota bacterium]
MMFWVYILKHRRTQQVYYGYTSDLRRRLQQHGDAWKIAGCEGYLAEEDGRERERKLKHYGQARTHLKNRLRRSLLK